MADDETVFGLSREEWVRENAKEFPRSTLWSNEEVVALLAERDRLAAELAKWKTSAIALVGEGDLREERIEKLQAELAEEEAEVDKAVTEMDQLRSDLSAARAEVAELLEDIVRCDGASDMGGLYDSMALSHVSDAMLRLAELGRFKIISDVGRRVFGRFKDQAQHQEDIA